MRDTMLKEIKVTCDEDMSKEEVQDIIDVIQKREQKWLDWISIEIAEGDEKFVTLNYKFKKVPFVRIRRITGYIVPDLDTWGDAKLAELNDRVKHGVEGMEKI